MYNLFSFDVFIDHAHVSWISLQLNHIFAFLLLVICTKGQQSTHNFKIFSNGFLHQLSARFTRTFKLTTTSLTIHV